MEFENKTRFSASLFRGDLPAPDMTLALVVAKVAGGLDSLGRLNLDLDTAEPILTAPKAHEPGHIPADVALRKQGMDVMALGQAYHPDPAGGPEATVTVAVGEHTRMLRVFGDRVWFKSSEGEWAISEPEPFSRMDMGWAQSFGGVSSDDDDNECPHPFNLEGKGFIASEDAIEDTELPNVEHPEQLIRSWQDHPAPCNIAPAPKPIAVNAEDLLPGLERAGGEPYKVPDAIWNDAVSLFRFDAAQPGTLITLTGMSERPISLKLPQLYLSALVQLGDRSHSLPLTLDTLLLFPDELRVLFTFRTSFKYRFVPRQTRVVQLKAAYSSGAAS